MDFSTPISSVLLCLLERAQTHVRWVGDAIQTSHALPPPSPFAFNLSQCLSSPVSWVLSNESALHIRWPKYWRFSFSNRPSNEHPGLIFFRMDWLDLLTVQGTLKSLLQHHNSKVSILWCSAIFMAQLLHLHITTGRTIVLTIQMKMKVLVTQSCPTLCDLMGSSPPHSSVSGILQARILEWVTSPFSRRPSQPRNWTNYRQMLYHLSYQDYTDMWL